MPQFEAVHVGIVGVPVKYKKSLAGNVDAAAFRSFN
jgi:hypothetical protein